MFPTQTHWETNMKMLGKFYMARPGPIGPHGPNKVLWARRTVPEGPLRRALPKTVRPKWGGGTLFFEGLPFCHQKGRRESWEFLNRCTFRFRSTPSSFFPTQKSVLGPVDLFVPFLSFHDMFFIFPVFVWGGTPKILKTKKTICGEPLGR